MGFCRFPLHRGQRCIPTTIPSPLPAAFSRPDRQGLFVDACCCWPGNAGVLKLGTVALDGTKVHANASRLQRAVVETRLTSSKPELKAERWRS